MTKEYQLPKDFAEKWVAALRSGKFIQSDQKLKNDAGYCCLGVACSIMGNDDKIYGKTYPSMDILPIEEMYKETPNEFTTLYLKAANLNDDKGYSFSDIADWIETNVEFI